MNIIYFCTNFKLEFLLYYQLLFNNQLLLDISNHLKFLFLFLFFL